MFENSLIIPIPLNDKLIELRIFGENNATIIEQFDALENGEALYQIKEGCFYEYKITDKYSLSPSEIISQSKVNESSGRIAPNIYVGTLNVDVLDPDKRKCGEVKLEVQSVKTSYRHDYRHMLEEITEKCTDLLLQHSSPVSQLFEVNFNADSNSLYQRFAFIKSILDSVEFNDSVNKIISAPVTRWKESETLKDIRNVKRFNNSEMKQLTNSNNRLELPNGHPVKDLLHSIPSKIVVYNKTETVDTPENRFIKHALISFLNFCSDFKKKVNNNNRIKLEAEILENRLEQYLGNSIFKEISSPKTLPLNSPILQRKEGYREVLRVWLMFDLAAKLIWHGGDDIYSGNKKDVAILYEYWIFFKLLDLIKEVFNIDPKSLNNLIKETEDGLGLQLKQGIQTPIEGIYNSGTRKLNIQFCYNKTFSSDNNYPAGGSWTKTMRPDYTLSIWPDGVTIDQAEIEEIIVHIHFDAKYKVESILDIVGSDDDFKNEKLDQRKGTFKRVDLLKMHSYKDAIRRTAGSYILYPGNDSPFTKFGFHELIPGLGAFAIRPSRNNSGIEALKKFLNDVVQHFLNRASQREKMSLKTYEIYKNNTINVINEPLPEAFGPKRNLIPDETFVLIGYYKNNEHFEWILKEKLYNARTESTRGSLRLGQGEASAKYLLLHTANETTTNKLYKITEIGPRVFSRNKLIQKGYPTELTDTLEKNEEKFYLVYKIEDIDEIEFENKSWDITKLGIYKTGRSSALPFSVSLTELMTVLI